MLASMAKAGSSSLIYQVVSWGDGVRGTDDSDTRYCTLAGVAKMNTSASAYTVANEFICGKLGMMIGLPIPPGVVIKTVDNELGYVSLRFGDSNERPPPVDPAEFVREKPEVAAGVIVFDCWIHHADRHDENLAFSGFGIPAVVFDHDRALFGRRSGNGDDSLRQDRDDPCVGTGCLAPYLDRLSPYLGPWIDVVQGLPDGVVSNVCREAIDARLLLEDEAYAAEEFLKGRRENLEKWLSIGVGGTRDLEGK